VHGARAVAVVAGAAVLAACTLALGGAEPVAADVGSDQAQIAALQQKIAADGAQVQQLVASADRAETQLRALQAQVATGQAALAADRQQLAKAQAHLRSIALESYMAIGDGGTALSLFTSDTTTLSAAAEYTRLAGDRLNAAIDAVNSALRRTQTAGAQLQSAQAQAQATVIQLTADRQAAQATLDRDGALLSGVKGDLQALLAAAAARQAAAQRAEEAALAAAAAAKGRGSGSQPTPPPVTITPTPGTYVNPLRDVRGLNPERIDQGVDYSGFGPIYAVGDGVVEATANAGWPGGTFICYKLTDGRANGLAVFAAEDINPVVKVGQTVTAATVLGTVYEGPSGIETGWADPACNGDAMASGVYVEGRSTSYGLNFSQLLGSLGAPPGVLQNDPPDGTLPPNWPTW
jgi:murein DD-endopeptidase MepM/ murein hydrolase activator NlpD